MAKIASFMAPLVDPDLDELQRVAADLHLAVRINATARALGRPAIELYAKRSGNPLLAVFRHACEGIDWLVAGNQGAAE